MERILFLNKFAGIYDNPQIPETPDAYKNLVRFFATGIIDRTQTLDQGFEPIVLDPVPGDITGVLPFDDIMLSRASELLNESRKKGHRIFLLWSGGIDSTAALLAFTDIAGEQILKEINIGCSHDSFMEFPELGKYLIDKGANLTSVVHPVTRDIPDNSLIVTGEHGDQLFGSDKMLPLVQAGLGNISGELYLPIIAAERLGTTRGVNEMIEYISPVLQKAPFPLIDICQYFWWINYVFKWQQVSLRIPVWGRKNIHFNYESSRHFYRTKEFEKWTLNQPEKCPSSVTDYKRPLKAFIENRFPCKRYFEEKTKEISLRPRAEKKWWELSRHRWMFIVGSDWKLHQSIIPHILDDR